jgi:hypothetical protein
MGRRHPTCTLRHTQPSAGAAPGPSVCVSHVVSALPDTAAAPAAAAAAAGELCVWRAARGAWEPLMDVKALPRCASLRLLHA